MDATNTARRIEAQRDWSSLDTNAEDWSRVGWRPGLTVVPERLIIDLPAHGELNILACRDLDAWSIAAVNSIETGHPVKLTQSERDLVERELTERRRSELEGI